VSLGETAELVADRYSVSRPDQDNFAVRSQRCAAEAMSAGRFNDELVAVNVPGRKNEVTCVDRDEHPRPETTVEQLARLSPAFRKGGTVTAGNSSGLNDGSAALLLVAADTGRELGLEPMARMVSTAVAGVEPDYMGIGPVPATKRALKRAGLDIDNIALAELNEAFAAQALACVRELGLNPELVNVNGGAIALGHPLGASGARILTTLVHELRRRGGGRGLASMCIGVGQGIATIVEVFPQ
jgi:acetyl-CoA acetyltransferase family protein